MKEIKATDTNVEYKMCLDKLREFADWLSALEEEIYKKVETYSENQARYWLANAKEYLKNGTQLNRDRLCSEFGEDIVEMKANSIRNNLEDRIRRITY